MGQRDWACSLPKSVTAAFGTAHCPIDGYDLDFVVVSCFNSHNFEAASRYKQSVKKCREQSNVEHSHNVL